MLSVAVMNALETWQECTVHTGSLHGKGECLTNRFELLYKPKSV